MKLQDERVLFTKRKIQSDGFQIVWVMLIISIFIQQYVYHAPFSQYVVELIMFIAISLYVLIANIGKGNDLFSSEKRRGNTSLMFNSFVAGVACTIMNTIINYMSYSDHIQGSHAMHILLVAGITFLTSTATAFIVLKVFYMINQKRQHTIEQHLNDHQDD